VNGGSRRERMADRGGKRENGGLRRERENGGWRRERMADRGGEKRIDLERESKHPYCRERSRLAV
jgi:hypothetical protein